MKSDSVKIDSLRRLLMFVAREKELALIRGFLSKKRKYDGLRKTQSRQDNFDYLFIVFSI